jgi:hypothetical protein
MLKNWTYFLPTYAPQQFGADPLHQKVSFSLPNADPILIPQMRTVEVVKSLSCDYGLQSGDAYE